MTRKKLYIVDLTDEEHEFLIKITKTGKSSAMKINKAKILLKADINGPGLTDIEIEEALDVSSTTIEKCRKKFVIEGLDAAITRKTYTSSKSRKKLTGNLEAKLIALVTSVCPEGYDRWTLRLVAERMVELEYIDSISHETIRQTLKKINLNLGPKNHG